MGGETGLSEREEEANPAAMRTGAILRTRSLFAAALGDVALKSPRALESVPRHRFAIDHNQCCRLQGGMRSNKRRSAADVTKLSDLRDRHFFHGDARNLLDRS
jgi:hypothetical protein